MKNPYKRSDVFSCHYAQHARFAHRVSAYHVLVEKKCYPQGCLMFRWSCALLNKGKTCTRGFSHMGRLCPGCSHYRDEKVHHQPSIQLSAQEFARYKEDLDIFEEWVSACQGKEQDITLRVDALKPRFLKIYNPHGGQLRLDGYLVIARRGFIGTDEMDDFFFAAITPQQQERFAFAPGDEIDARGIFILDRGRVLFRKIWSVEFNHRSGRSTWNNSQALVAKASARSFPRQPQKCARCPQGALVDVAQRDGRIRPMQRELVCLQGIQDEQNCYLSTLQAISETELICAGGEIF